MEKVCGIIRLCMQFIGGKSRVKIVQGPEKS
jgi:hypothetical protein